MVNGFTYRGSQDHLLAATDGAEKNLCLKRTVSDTNISIDIAESYFLFFPQKKTG